MIQTQLTYIFQEMPQNNILDLLHVSETNVTASIILCW